MHNQQLIDAIRQGNIPLLHSYIRVAMFALGGMHYDDYADHACEYGNITQRMYDIILRNSIFKDSATVIEHMGLITYLYTNGIRNRQHN